MCNIFGLLIVISKRFDSEWSSRELIANDIDTNHRHVPLQASF